jgi:nicotinamidase-related amidase
MYFRDIMKYIILLFCLFSLAANKPAATINFTVQKRVAAAGKDNFTVVKEVQQWDAAQTAIIICDMWDQHWCKGATGRVKEIAPYMNNVLNIARQKGILIVHSPSDCMNYYKEFPQRKLAEKYASPDDSDGGELLPAEKNAVWPIDQSNGGCTDTPRCEQRNAWKKQIDALEIKDGDVISDAGNEIEKMFKEKGIKQVILMGVHTNMCIVNRTFGMRNMTRYGMKVALMRDLTDAMYDSRQAPYVNHFQGLGMMIEYIEKYIGPTVTSTDLTGKPPFRFTGDTRY